MIFDLDDMLYDETHFCRSGLQAAASHVAVLSDAYSVEAFFAAPWNCVLTGERGSTFNLTLAELGIPCDGPVIHEVVEVYRTHTPTLTLPPESRAVVADLKDRYTLGLLTDGCLPTQKLKIPALGIGRCFRAVLYTEELDRWFWKPSLGGVEKLVEHLRTRPDETICVADNETKDFIALNRLGLPTVRLLCPTGLYRQPWSRATPRPGPKSLQSANWRESSPDSRYARKGRAPNTLRRHGQHVAPD